jgi:hypothetical protein
LKKEKAPFPIRGNGAFSGFLPLLFSLHKLWIKARASPPRRKSLPPPAGKGKSDEGNLIDVHELFSFFGEKQLHYPCNFVKHLLLKSVSQMKNLAFFLS